jgi:hypothetical protein
MLGTKMKLIRTILALAVMSLAANAMANPVSVSTSKNQIKAGSDNQGWFADNYSTGVRDNLTDNYGTGNGGYYDVRSFFIFDLSGLTGTVEAATFKVRRYEQTADGRLDLRSLSKPADKLVFNRSTDEFGFYDSLGSGTNYGSAQVSIGASEDVLSFVLNAAAIADLNANLNRSVGGGYFALAASFESAGYIFGKGYNEPGFGGSNSVQELELTFKNADVPLPGGVALVGLGLVAFGASRKRKAA